MPTTTTIPDERATASAPAMQPPVAAALRKIVRGSEWRELRAEHRRLHAAVAAANEHSELAKEEIYAVRMLYRRIRSARTPEAQRKLAAEFTQRANEYEARVPLSTVENTERPRQMPVDLDPPRRVRRPTRAATAIVAPSTAQPAQALRNAKLRDQKYREETAKRLVIARAMESGLCARQALERLTLATTRGNRRWAQRVFATYRKSGRIGDQRADRRTPILVMSQEMQKLIYALWTSHPGANSRGVEKMVRDHVTFMQERLAAGQPLGKDTFLSEAVIRAGGPLPSLSSIKQFLASIPRVGHEMRKGGKALYRRNLRALAPANFATRPNEEWQSDNTLLDITLKAKKKGVWKAVRPFMTASVDAFSRAIPGFVLSFHTPDAWTSVHLLRHAILPDPTATQSVFGLPERLVMDNGADFTSHRIKLLLAELHTVVEYCDPHVPDQKGEIEALFGTITRELLPTLPGSTKGKDRGTPWSDARVAGLLTIDRLREIIHAWIINEYHPRQHSQTGEAPIKRWASAAGLVQPVGAQELDPLLLVSEATRKVVRGMIRFTPPGKRVRRFYAPELHAYTGERVQIRYNPDDLESILLYSARGERLAEAWRMYRQGGRYSYQEVLSDERRFANEVTAQRRDLVERLPDYYAHARASDRPEKEDKHAAEPVAASGRDEDAADVAERVAVQQTAAELRAALRAERPLPDADRADPRVNPDALLDLFRATA